jgi:hypothetical protein
MGIHLNMPSAVPPEIFKALGAGAPAPAELSADERRAYEQLDVFFKKGLAYAQEMTNRPQTLYAMEDSPVGLAAWILDHDIRSYELIARVFDGKSEGLTRDDVLDNALLADEHGRVFGAALLGKQAGVLRTAGRDRPGRRERLSRRALPSPAQLGGKGFPETDPL